MTQSCVGVLRQAAGMGSIVASGIFVNGNIVLSKVLKDAGWPYFRFMGTASLIISGIILLGQVAALGWDGLSCSKREIKWVMGRGLCGTFQFLFAVLAAVAGAGMGDIGALSSINTVVAALLGRIVLGERLGPWHVGAMLLSIAGAILISDPRKLGSSGNPSAWVGYTLALLSGISFGLMFICTRKSKSASSWLLTISAMGQRGMACWILAGTPAVDDNTYENIVASPWLALGLLILLVVVTFLGNFTATVGGKRCPAAISATLMTAVSMGVGYGAQIIIFKQLPNVLTLLGAGMMLLAVVVMALARLPVRQDAALASTNSTLEAGTAPITPSPSAASDAEPRSLVSFVASEYAERQPPEHEEEEVMEEVKSGPSELRPRPVTLGAGPVAFA